MKNQKSSIYDELNPEIKRTIFIGDGVGRLIPPPGFTYSHINTDLRNNLKETFQALYYLKKDPEWRKFIHICKENFNKKTKLYLHWMYIPRRNTKLRVNQASVQDKSTSFMTVWADLSHWARVAERPYKPDINAEHVLISRGLRLEISWFLYSFLNSLYNMTEITHTPTTNKHTARQLHKFMSENREAMELSDLALGTRDEFTELINNNTEMIGKLVFIQHTLVTASLTPLHRGVTKINQ